MIIEFLRKRIYCNCWKVGVIEANEKTILECEKLPTVHWLNYNNTTGWIADPFIYDVNENTILLLVEEFKYKTRKGHISLVTLDRHSYKILRVETVLEEHTHLSFPAVLRDSEGTYIYPENGDRGELVLYRFDPLNRVCTPARVLSEGKYADSVITDLFGGKLMFSTVYPNYNGSILTIAEEREGMYTPCSNILFTSNIARNAGEWFKIGNKVFRPAQDCSNLYGGAVIIQEVTEEDGHFIFHERKRIESPSKRYNTGCHTFNSLNGISVIDVHGYRYPLLLKIAEQARKLYWLLKGAPNRFIPYK